MNTKDSLMWLEKLENSMLKLTNVSKDHLSRIKELADFYELPETKFDCIDFENENIFTTLENLDSKDKNKTISKLEKAVVHSTNLLNISKENLENIKKEYALILNKAKNDINAIETVNNFLNVWRNKINSGLSLNDYPKSFIDCLQRVGDNEQKVLLEKELFGIKKFKYNDEKPINLNFDCTGSSAKSSGRVLKDKNEFVASGKKARGYDHSVLDYTRYSDELCIGTVGSPTLLFTPQSFTFNNPMHEEVNSDVMNEEVQEDEEESVSDPLNTAIYGDEPKGNHDRSGHVSSNDDDYPSMERPLGFINLDYSGCPDDFVPHSFDDRSIDDTDCNFDTDDRGSPDSVKCSNPDARISISENSFEYSFNKTKEDETEND